jgi:hypothetical protein
MGITESNEERLKAAGIVDPHKPLTPEQSAALDGLSKKQVDDLIEMNEQLGDALTSYNEILSMPGRIGGTPQGGKP